MPLTFAHPAIALPLARNSRYVNFLAFVLGTMAPDFEYFLKGRPSAEIGHSYSGFFTYNLPILVIVYWIYNICIHRELLLHLPNFLQEAAPQKPASSQLLKVLVFVYSALFGMFSHVAWDSFTHVGGLMVRNFKVFTYTFSIFEFNIPLYKMLQHGSTIFGLLAIIGYLFYRARKNPLLENRVTSKQKCSYWSLVAVCSMVLFLLWILLSPVSLHAYGILVVRLIDCVLLSILIVSLYVVYSTRSQFTSQ